ncbi:Asp-tRNA(Asn)/Glu-tRNA(Gln) amidotransferase subunit GatB [Eisenibacter elegans]|uniref:Asp-tRNA(Asn)/Glu-tRNA(Gln) amidotransferase subunit GatB n=1 Tax=Eisenibacter elegans TaxID=997 RepID=UPI0003F9CD48|nr:Asp-tRNA(Asn)/Glu-tRNA(Gln) amidotransferase subunit GatB [Eisenibacter elegans]
MANTYELVVGLEVHAQLLTQSKAYAPDSTEYGSLPNTNISVITLGHPGTLPRVNEKSVEYAVKMGLACGSDINRYNIFARKNYFYPDLPKGYQITQDKGPICAGGHVTIRLKDGSERQIGITRIHLEEDAGKSIHLAEEVDTLVDFNRAGVPLIEIVSEPDIRTAEEAYAYLTEIRKLVRYLGICDGNMEEGSLRCDANISVRKPGEPFGTRVEVKNMNSIRNVQRAIEYEFERQVALVEQGISFKQHTRTFNAVDGKTYSMREKEDMNDYRYFPEPDLTPVVISDEDIAQIKAQMPPLPRELYLKYTQEFGLSDYDAEVLTATKEVALYYNALCQQTKNYKAAANWVTGDIKAYLNKLTLSMEQFPVSPEKIAGLIEIVDQNKVSYSIAAQKIFPALIEQPEQTALSIAERENLLQESDEGTLQAIIAEVIAAFPDKVREYQAGKKGLTGMFMGQIMKKTQGKADPKRTNDLLAEALDKATV